MKIQSLLLASALAFTGAMTVPLQSAQAQASLDIRIGTPPPPPRVERVPPPRRGWVWAPGYWRWNGHRHVWIVGHWERERPGYHFDNPHWEEDNGNWRFNHGGWSR